jgi:hypothetical protein
MLGVGYEDTMSSPISPLVQQLKEICQTDPGQLAACLWQYPPQRYVHLRQF